MDIHTNLSIIIPNHNEKNVEWVYSYCRYFFPHAEIIIENDPIGKGKGHTIREGISKTSGEKIVFIDGDMDIHPREINKLMEYSKDYDVVIGTKEIKYVPFNRKVISLISRKFIKLMFNLPINDTQTGLKLFKKSALYCWKTDGYLFDVELLYKAHKQGHKIKEIPINATITKHKTFKVLVNSICEIVNLWYRLLFRPTKV